MHDSRPKYVERNKEWGEEFNHIVPAEIIYCDDIESWVFRHQHIRTANTTKQQEEQVKPLHVPQMSLPDYDQAKLTLF